jgi:predicted transcriptional regulator
MDSDDADVRVVECDSCGTVAVGDGTPRCCGELMEPQEGKGPVESPTTAELLGTVFGMSDTELELCLCVMEGGELTVRELADETDYDRSVVARHLNHLADLGVVEKRRRLIESGGHVYVYVPVPAETVRERLRAPFLAWVAAAADRLGELQREKVEAIAASEGDPTWAVFRRE